MTGAPFAAAPPDSALRRRGAHLAALSNGARPPAPLTRPPRFTAEEIVAKVREWTQHYGTPPATNDWEPSRARAAGQDWRAHRFDDGDWPSVGMVRRQFATFNEAIRAAGFEPRGGPARQKRHLTAPDQILAAIVEWTRRYGAPPSQTDWDSARARRTGQTWRIARYEHGDWPSLNTVRRHFGSLNRAILEAGLRPRGPGQRRARAPQVRLDALLAVGAPDHETAATRPAQLADAIRAVATARRSPNHRDQQRALIELAAVALAWAEGIDAAELAVSSPANALIAGVVSHATRSDHAADTPG